jgi:hypothetical protein
MRSWVDSLERVIKAWKTKAGDSTGTRIVDGIVQGVNYKADSTLLCKDFAPRVQTINVMKRGKEKLSSQASCANSLTTLQWQKLRMARMRRRRGKARHCGAQG